MISDQNEVIQKLYNNSMIFSFISKLSSIDKIITVINELINNKTLLKYKNTIRKNIADELIYIGYDISHKGTQNLISVIEYCMTIPIENLDNLEKNIYSKIAKIHNVSLHNIKCNIKRANEFMYCNCEIEKLKKYFKIDYDIKPKTKTIISTVINKIS